MAIYKYRVTYGFWTTLNKDLFRKGVNVGILTPSHDRDMDLDELFEMIRASETYRVYSIRRIRFRQLVHDPVEQGEVME